MNKLTARISARFLLFVGLILSGIFLVNTLTLPASAVDQPSTTITDDDPIITQPNTEEEGTNNADNTNNPDTPTEDTPETTDTTTATESNTSDTDHDACREQTGALSWLVCPGSGVIANAIDALYTAISDMLEVSPVSMDSSSPIYIVWQYARNITNIIFIIFLLIVIYSQLTGLGINNYGIKRILPRLIIAVLLVNLSFIICSLAVDVSNIIGNSLRGFFASVQDTILASAEASDAIANFSISSLLATILSGGAIAGVVISAVGGGGYLFFMFLIVLVSALIAVVSGLITISARQALVALLIMIAPLAFVAYLLPNTEKWFTRWKDLLFRMLVFYPMFSFLFGASQLVGYALITSANSGFGIILGVGVQIFPLFFSWSLMKMSGTILNGINNGIRRAANPLQKGLAGWSLSKADQQRQHHIANSNFGGARLRNYLDYRRVLRELDTENSAAIRKNRATERAYKVASSSLGHDANGNLSWKQRANRYTINAKRAKLTDTRATTAQTLYQNTLSGYGDFFKDHTGESKRISTAHGEAFQDAMAQQFLSKNLAQADQDWLLSKYFQSGDSLSAGNPYQYNRLVKSANGTLQGSLGEISVLGQVIAESAAIENRRRGEARIILNKFPYDKAQFRAMIYDLYQINDNGYAMNSKGKVVEDKHYNLKPRMEYEEYPHYFAVHKETGERIEKDEYNSLSDEDRDDYRKVRYMTINDDKGNFRQLITTDDAGYMKEMLVDNVSIADPINRRYATVLGAARDGFPEGILRRYQSTIISAYQNSKYKEHDASMTSMLFAQLAQGLIHTSGQLHIAQLQSLNVASKNGPILINDKHVLENWRELIANYNDDEIFSQYITDQDIMEYRNVNKEKLGGLILKTNPDGSKDWEEIKTDKVEQLDYQDALAARKNLVKHKILAKAANRLFTATNRDLSQNTLDDQKPATLQALDELLDTLTMVGISNLDPAVPFEEKIRATEDGDIFANPNPKVLRQKAQSAQQARDYIQQAVAEDDNFNLTDLIKNAQDAQALIRQILGKKQAHQSTESPTQRHANQTTERVISQLEYEAQAKQQYNERNNFLNIQSIIADYATYSQNIDDFTTQILQYFSEVESLNNLIDDLNNLIEEDRKNNYAHSTEEAINNITDHYNREQERINNLYEQIIQLIRDRAQTT